jgi:hypothetical protein
MRQPSGRRQGSNMDLGSIGASVAAAQHGEPSGCADRKGPTCMYRKSGVKSATTLPLGKTLPHGKGVRHEGERRFLQTNSNSTDYVSHKS